MLQKLFQEEYVGEFIITSITLRNNKKTETREWIEPSFTNTNHNNVAHVIGNGTSREKFPLRLMDEVHGGLLAKDMGQSYGCNAVARDFMPDFLILNSQKMADEFSELFPCDKTIAVSWTKNLLRHPGKYHLMPYNVRLCAGASAAYLACFHGHKKIYLIGFDNQNEKTVNNNLYAGTNGYKDYKEPVPESIFIKDLNDVMKTYIDTEFVRVVTKVKNKLTPEAWKWRENYSEITYKQYISYCDFGSHLHYLKT